MTTIAVGDTHLVSTRAPAEVRNWGPTCPASTAIRPGGHQGVAYPGGMARAYDVTAVERKWQRHWDDEGTYQIDNDDPREKFYALTPLPSPFMIVLVPALSHLEIFKHCVHLLWARIKTVPV